MKRGLRALAAAVVVAAPIAPGVAHAATAPSVSARPSDHPAKAPVGRVLLLSLPAITWEDIGAADAPNLDRLFAQSALADLMTRAAGRRYSLGNGYVTIGAGARAVTPDRVAGDGYDANEIAVGGTAAEIFARRTGATVAGGLVQLGIADTRAANLGNSYDAHVGAFADALAAEGYSRAAIGNADALEVGSQAAGIAPVSRPVVSGIMGADGTVPAGRVDTGLLEPAGPAPFGVHLDPLAVESAFRMAWKSRGVVLVEASDLIRADAYAGFTDIGTARRLRLQAIAHTDVIVGRLLREVDPSRDAVVVASPLASRSSGGLAIASVRAPGVASGLLSSGTSRRAGFVDIVDVAPTVLSIVGIDRPAEMEGRVMTVDAPDGAVADRLPRLVQASRDSVFRDDHQGQVTSVLVLLCALLAGLAALALSRIRQVLVAIEWFALGIVGFVTATYVAGPMHFVTRGGSGAYWLFLFGFAVLFAAVCTLLGRRTFCDALLVALGLTVVVHVVDLVTGARLELNTVLGYSPTVGIRVAGEGNLTFSVLSSSAVFLAGLLAWRLRQPAGRIVAVVVLTVTLLVMISPTWGQDFGSAAAAPGFVLLGWMLFGRRIQGRTVLVLGGVLLALGLSVGFLDLLRPPDRQTHVGRFFSQVGRDGLGGLLGVVRRKAGENLQTFGHTVFVWVFPVGLGFSFVYLFMAQPGTLVGLLRRITTLKATLLAFGVTAVLGYALNDSGVAVPAMMAVIAECAVVFLVVREHRRVPDPGVTGVAARRALGLRGRLVGGGRGNEVAGRVGDRVGEGGPRCGVEPHRELDPR